MNSYEQKKQARIERLRDRADRLAREGAARVERASKMADVIPFGQPILVGHYSEGRDRRYRDRIHNTFAKGFEMTREAQDVARRADAAERNDAISSDDPEAVTKLKEKVAELKAEQARMEAVNRALRAKKTDEEIAALTNGWATPAVIAELRKPDFCGRTGFADYQLKNNSGNIRRVEARIADLERRATKPAKEPEEVGDVRIEEVDNRVRVFFPGKPSEAIRSFLKSAGFRWSPSEGAWQRQPGYSFSVSMDAWDVARKAADMTNPVLTPSTCVPLAPFPAEVDEDEEVLRRSARES